MFTLAIWPPKIWGHWEKGKCNRGNDIRQTRQHNFSECTTRIASSDQAASFPEGGRFYHSHNSNRTSGRRFGQYPGTVKCLKEVLRFHGNPESIAGSFCEQWRRPPVCLADSMLKACLCVAQFVWPQWRQDRCVTPFPTMQCRIAPETCGALIATGAFQEFQSKQHLWWNPSSPS